MKPTVTIRAVFFFNDSDQVNLSSCGIFFNSSCTPKTATIQAHKLVLFEFLKYAYLTEAKSPPSVVSGLPRRPTEWTHYERQ